MGITSVVRLGDRAEEVNTDMFSRPLEDGLLMQLRGGDFTFSQVIPATETRIMLVNLFSDYNRIYQRDNFFNMNTLALFGRNLAINFAEMAMHERCVGQCTSGVKPEDAAMIDKLISASENLAEVCDQILKK